MRDWTVECLFLREQGKCVGSRPNLEGLGVTVQGFLEKAWPYLLIWLGVEKA